MTPEGYELQDKIEGLLSKHYLAHTGENYSSFMHDPEGVVKTVRRLIERAESDDEQA